MKQKKNQTYEAPMVEVLEIALEQGFAGSGTTEKLINEVYSFDAGGGEGANGTEQLEERDNNGSPIVF